MQTRGSGSLPEWLASRVQVVASRQSPAAPKRLELTFAGVDLPDRLPELVAWLRAPRGLAQQALEAADADFVCWADFRGTRLQDSDAADLLECLGNLRVARLWLASNSLTQKSAGRLRDFVHHADCLRDLDLACNDLDDEAVFGLISAMAARSRCYQRWLYLAGNQVRNPPALLERLRRSGVHVCLDEEPSDIPREVDQICLPHFCFQGPDMVDRDPGLDQPEGREGREGREGEEASSRKTPAVPNLSAKASKDVTSALRALRTMIPPESDQTPQAMPQAGPTGLLGPLPPLADDLDSLNSPSPFTSFPSLTQLDGFDLSPANPLAPLLLQQMMPIPSPAMMSPCIASSATPALNTIMPLLTPAPNLNTTSSSGTASLPTDLLPDLGAAIENALLTLGPSPMNTLLSGPVADLGLDSSHHVDPATLSSEAPVFGASLQGERSEVGEAPWKSQRRRARKPGAP
ncbi:unnamed protein product [Symbiodinium natans]|uniref:Uncharacterized protein n=1 Tax=Symbiodinium natans TaxID=878477 RepID=A0A812K5I5_9DINO|nr:unnamed protein product [Symbiodinium natans]